MLDFRRGSRLRAPSRRRQRRLSLLLLAVGLAVALTSQSARFSQTATSSSTQSAADSEIYDGLHTQASTPDSAIQVDRQLLESVEDNTPFRSVERPAWFHLLGLLNSASRESLDRAEILSPSYVQLDRQPREYRGRLVRITGVARRAEATSAPPNDEGIDRYFRLAITPDDSPDDLLFVYVLELPPRFPVELQIEESVQFVGFSFKRWLYAAHDRVRPAPVLLARSIDWQPSPPASRRQAHPWFAVVAAGMALAAIAIAAIWLRTRRPPKADRDTPPASFVPPAILLACVLLLPTAASATEAASENDSFRELIGIDNAEFDMLDDGKPWQKSEDSLLYEVFFRMRNFTPGEFERWVIRSLDWDRLGREPQAFKGGLYQLDGNVTLVEAIKPDLALAERLELPEYFRCRMSIGENRKPAVVFARTVPSAWKRGVEISEPSGAKGLLLKLGEPTDGQSTPIFVAARLAWFPDTPLGRLGMDVGLLDDLRPEEATPAEGNFSAVAADHLDRFRLTARNREAFYQMLAAVGRSEPGQLERWAREGRSSGPTDSVVALFNEPLGQQGRLVTLSGEAREITEILVSDSDVRERFGIDRYYVIFLFTDDSQGNPLAFCVRRLPPGLSPGGGPRFNQPVSVTGFFFNSWAYRSRETEAGGRAKWQLAPLLMGREPTWNPQPSVTRRASSPTGWLTIGAFFAAAIWLAWRLRGRGRTPPDDRATPRPDFTSLG